MGNIPGIGAQAYDKPAKIAPIDRIDFLSFSYLTFNRHLKNEIDSL